MLPRIDGWQKSNQCAAPPPPAPPANWIRLADSDLEKIAPGKQGSRCAALHRRMPVSIASRDATSGSRLRSRRLACKRQPKRLHHNTPRTSANAAPECYASPIGSGIAAQAFLLPLTCTIRMKLRSIIFLLLLFTIKAALARDEATSYFDHTTVDPVKLLPGPPSASSQESRDERATLEGRRAVGAGTWCR